MLKPLRDANVNNVKDPPPRICEACGNIVQIGHFAINCIIVIGSPGHPDLMPFQCQNEEHWACSIECWSKVAHSCVDEHMTEMLKNKHRSLKQ